jgi:hypothetical protein
MPPAEFGVEGVQSGILSYHRYNLQFLKMSGILKHMLHLNKNTDFFHLTIAKWKVFKKNILDWL